MVSFLTPLPYHIGLVILQDFPLFMFLYVVTTKVITHFNDNDKGLKCADRRPINQNRELCLWKLYSEVTSTALPDPSPFWYYTLKSSGSKVTWVCLNKASLWSEFSIRFNWWRTRSFFKELNFVFTFKPTPPLDIRSVSILHRCVILEKILNSSPFPFWDILHW